MRARDRKSGDNIVLLLDNFEQVEAAAPLLPELLNGAAHLKLLVTSRTGLRLSGEHEYPVPPLALPEPVSHGRPYPSVERLRQYAAVEVFILRAQRVNPDFDLTPANAPAVVEICRRVDGLPLAIELAAARSKLFPPQALLARLGHRLTVLTGGARDLPIRHRTLRAAIDWSYDLLTATEQQLFIRLAVFVGGWTLEAAEDVCHPTDDLGLDVVDGLQSLLDKSLVRMIDPAHPAPGLHPPPAGGEPRFTMLETIREYALAHVVAGGEAEAFRLRHARFYLELVLAAELESDGPEQAAWLERLAAEYGNLRAALSWSLAEMTPDASTHDLGLRLAAVLRWFWYFRGYLSEGRRWLATALDRHGRGDWPGAASLLARSPHMLTRDTSLDMCRQRGSFVDQLPATRAATLVLAGQHDPILPPAVLKQTIIGVVPGARLAVVDCGHEMPLERPQETAALLEAFLAGLR